MHLRSFTALCFLVGVYSLRFVTLQGPDYPQEGQTITLRCDYGGEGAPLHSVKWFRNGLEFYRFLPTAGSWAFPEKGMMIDLLKSDDKQVVLKNVSVTLSGTYDCEVSEEAPTFTTRTATVKLNISKPVEKELPKIELLQEIHSDTNRAVLRCDYSLSGERLYSFKMYKDGNEFYRYAPAQIPSTQEFLLPGVTVDRDQSDDKLVTLTNLTRETSGNYTCQASGGPPTFLTVRATDYLNITRVGILHDIRLTLPVNAKARDASATLECTYDLDGEPLKDVRWFKDMKQFYTYSPDTSMVQVTPAPGVSVNVSASDATNIMLTNITLDTAGDYYCQVTTNSTTPQAEGAGGHLNVQNADPQPPGNVFNRAVNWLRDRWHRIRN